MSDCTEITKQIDLGYEYMGVITADKEGLTLDYHEIVNNDDGWIDGYDFSWDEVWKVLREHWKDEIIKLNLKNYLKEEGKNS